MTTINYAFPSAYNPQTGAAQYGMTLRDYFAAKAMQAMLHQGSNVYDLMAARAYEIADEMMKARDA
jgi:hypothetical protein